MKKINLFAAVLLMMAAMLTSCGAKRQMAYQQPPYYQQPYQQAPYAQQQPMYQQPPQQQPIYSQPTKRVVGPEAKVREWESKGMELAGNSGLFDMYTVAEQVYNKLAANKDKYVLTNGVGVHSTSRDAAKNAALQNAIQYYASQCGTVIKGRVEREYSTFTDIDKLVTAYSGYVEGLLRGYFNEELAVYRKTDNGYEVECWYTVEENNARVARQQAMTKALQELAVEQTTGENIKKFVDEAMPSNSLHE